MPAERSNFLLKYYTKRQLMRVQVLVVLIFHKKRFAIRTDRFWKLCAEK